MEFLFHQLLTKHTSIQSDLEINNMKNYVILKEHVKLINVVRALYNSLYVFLSLMIITCFNASNSSTNTLFTISSFCKVLITLKIKLMVKEVIVE